MRPVEFANDEKWKPFPGIRPRKARPPGAAFFVAAAMDIFFQDHDYRKLDNLFNENKPLQTCFDFRVFAEERIRERIPLKASLLEKTACIVRMSVESLLWLITDAHSRYDEIEKRSQGEYVSPYVFHNRTLFPQFWVYEVVKTIILSSSFPLEFKAHLPPRSIAPDREYNSDFRKFWPHTPGATAFYGAGSSTAEAVSQALFVFLQKSCLCDFPDLPNYQALSVFYEPYDRRVLMAEHYKTENVMPLVETWQNLSCFLASEYMSPEKWTLGDLEREYSRVMSLLDHEYNVAKKMKHSTKQDGNEAVEHFQGEKPKGPGNPNISADACAVGYLSKNPSAPVAEIAKAIGVSRPHMYKLRMFKAARELLAKGKDDIPNGDKYEGFVETVEERHLNKLPKSYLNDDADE